MVKIPKLDDLKKMGSDLLDSAKSGKFGGVVDKLTSGMTAKTAKTTADVAEDEPLSKVLTTLQEAINEMNEIDKVQSQVIKKMQNQMMELVNLLQSYEKVSETKTSATETKTPTEPPTDQKQG